MTYNGTTYRSTLEADWAATFDSLNWYFEYEPWAVDLGDGTQYLADFHLSGQNVWCEVKGAHNERLAKTRRFHQALADSERPGGELVVILRAAGEPGRSANWQAITGAYRSVTVQRCGICAEWCFTQNLVDGQFCRHCEAPEGLNPEHQYISAIHAKSLEQEHSPAFLKALQEDNPMFRRLPFVSAPRPTRRGSR
ncbi:hypothetical protein [Acrocarpospora sp. B8E8]|uniref:hypothetical protein n=1 Tax=Acrocarpospora sp. B8E8 TaxID=3153572 RepID=UPI00325F971E